MKSEMELEALLHDMANPEPPENLKQNVLQSCMTSLAEEPKSAKSPKRGAAPLFVSSGAEENTLVSLGRNLFEWIFPPRTTPLQTKSRPIPVVDRMATERDHLPALYALAAHAFAIFMIGFVVRAQIRDVEVVHSTPLIEPPVLRIVARASSQSGGGGGQHGPTPVSRGRLPRLEQQQIIPPANPPLLPPKIAIEPSVVIQNDVKLADNALPNIGLPSSPLLGTSMGTGRGTGLGPGNGDGVGPGRGGNIGDGLRHVGGSVSAPELLHGVEPEFTEEARKAKLSGDVTVYLWVNEHGDPTHIRVMRGIGMGLDERAVEAVKQYKFRPAMENGKPVMVEMYVVVNFTIL